VQGYVNWKKFNRGKKDRWGGKMIADKQGKRVATWKKIWFFVIPKEKTKNEKSLGGGKGSGDVSRKERGTGYPCRS